jgi:FKBP-type peptidyl-prolyl cis-trans isomerase
MKKIIWALLPMSLFSLNTDAQEFKKTASGLEYAMLKDVPGINAIKDGSYVKMHIRTKIADSSLFDSYLLNNNEPIEQQLTSQFLGAFMEGFSLLSEGDSAILKLPVEKAFKDSPLPPFAKAGDPVQYEVRVFTIKTKEQYEKAKEEATIAQNKIDDKLIKKYVRNNKIKALKTASGIYYKVEKKGNGKRATAADNVKVHYKGTKLDGTTFDSSYDRGEPIDFPLSGVIKGWTEGIPLLEEQGKGKLIIPSSLCYAQNPPQGSKIKPNEILIFDVELIAINPPAPQQEQPQVQAEEMKVEEVDPKVQNAIDAKLIDEYIIQNKLKTVKTASGLHYIIEQKGNGKFPQSSSTVKVHYKGTTLDGNVFDSSYDRNEPIEFPLNRVIKGWQEGILLMDIGSKGKLIIPSTNAYGSQSPSPAIKPNSVLVFDVELLDVK